MSYRMHSAARGMARGSELKRIVISLDNETFEEVLAGAHENECSFAAEARMLIEVGLETLKMEQAAHPALTSIAVAVKG